ncbi:MAG TPA: chemotaxis protein CheD [Oligoflexus sp.]|uniref:chemotaxis protein CheD n=1 Tax=Oligoflexus sp. TaxID=1971216 RepID=UPI002D48CCD8|nr:chemotaxis protein CheD [Oligoflexus sp.]HYX33155.1 chemotaxis protein CheD [Oligoflexus sp.]
MIAKPIMLGIGNLDGSSQPGSTLKTMALGSCVALILMDPKKKAIGMAHVALPESATDSVKALSLPGYFADTAVPALLNRMANLGCDPRGTGFIVKLVGGSSIMDVDGLFNIGKRNVLTLKKVLWQTKLAPVAEDVGGDFSRTVAVHQDTGHIVITCPSKGTWEI